MRGARLHQICILATATFLLAPQSQGGLIGFWNFDETSGTTAHDTSGSGINGTLSSSGAAFDPGAGLGGGGAVSISSGGYVDMGNQYAFSGTQSFTVQAWIDATGREHSRIRIEVLFGKSGRLLSHYEQYRPGVHGFQL
jgi:hypothetical protein